MLTRSFFTFTLALVAVLAILSFHLFPILEPREIAGWDLTGHYFLSESMLRLLSVGKIHGYDDAWFAGYPAFSMYPPLPYIVVALLHVIVGKQMPMTLAFNVIVFLIPPFTILSLAWTSYRWAEIRSASFAVLLGALFFTLPARFGSLAMGFSGLLRNGYFSAFFALPILLVLLGNIARKERRAPLFCLRRVIVGALLFAAIILSHQITALFATFCLLLSLLISTHRIERRRGPGGS